MSTTLCKYALCSSLFVQQKQRFQKNDQFMKEPGVHCVPHLPVAYLSDLKVLRTKVTEYIFIVAWFV